MSIGKSIALTLVLVIGCVAQSGCSSSNCDGLYCNNQCVQVDSDPNNCGSCGQKCGPSQVCDQSKCTDSCSGGLKQCDRACVDVTSSTAHCGGCNKPCATGQQCTAGKCQGGTGKDGGIEPDTSTPQCTDRVAITANGALDLDLKVVTVSGKVTKNGQAIPAATQYNHRGRLEFVDKYGVTLPVKRFGPSGDATYQIDLIADTYDVYYNSLAGSNCEDTLPLPCHYPRVLIKKNVQATASGGLDIDIKVSRVTGNVSKNGQAVSSATQYSHRGRLEFVDERGSTLAAKRFAASGATSYDVELVAGTYDVYYNSLAGSNCEDTLPLPCHYPRALLKSAVNATSSGGLDIDVKVSRVTGSVSKNGQAVPSATQYSHRGRLEFVDVRGSTLAAKRFAASGATSYDVELIAGNYDVYYNALAGSNCEDTLPLPCHHPRALLKSAVNATSSGGLDIDVKTATVSGNVSKNGQALPSATQYSHRGRLEFVDERGSTLAAKRFTANGATTYATEVIAGPYDIYYNALAGSNCEDKLPLPCHTPRKLLRGCGAPVATTP
ncbi:MAG: hypothetical protein H6707_10315 [Deltaproteobacteria bacterium]|nr:hypothetical protein [Deltaproteobacteria bacterium]